MLKNYFKIAVRNILRRPGYGAINIFGLAVGLAACLLIITFVRHEYLVNRSFDDLDALYRVNSTWHEDGDAVRLLSFSPLAEAVKAGASGVANAVRYTAVDADIRIGATPFRVPTLIAGPEFFQIFSFAFIAGDPNTALQNPQSVVITESEANKLFGRTDVLGETISFSSWGGEGFNTFRVTGVIERPPFNTITHIGQESQVFISFANATDFFGNVDFDNDWSIYNTVTYVKLNPGADKAAVDKLMASLTSDRLPPSLNGKVTLLLEPLKDVYLNDANGSARRLAKLVLLLGFLILGIACFNYINLSTAMAVARSKEVGMRKTLGASRGQLVLQYLGESVLVCALGMGIALVLARTGVGPFNELIGRTIPFEISIGLWTLVAGLIALVGVLGGLYPAFYLAKVQPSKSLKALATSGKSAERMRKSLIVLQFAIASGLLIGAAFVNLQADHIASQEVGFDEEQLLVVSSLPREWTVDGVEKLDVIKNAVQGIPGIEHVSVAWGPPGPRYTGLAWEVETQENPGNTLTVPISNVDAAFLNTMDIQLKAGAFFDPERPALEQVAVINEAAARLFGWQEPVDKTFTVDGMTVRVLGVVNDYYTQGLEQVIGPVALVDVRQFPLYRELLVRLPKEDSAKYLNLVQEAWLQVYPDIVFDYYFLDQQWADMHQWITRTRRIAGIATVLAMLVACLGLLGVISISVSHRTREIGIRKVIGASVPSLLRLLSIDFIKLVGVAFLIGAPVAYWAVNNWLEKFANRIEVGPEIFLGAGMLVLSIAAVTMALQSVRAAFMNPVDTLRHE